MNKSDIEFTIGLNTSPAERQLDTFYQNLKSKNSIAFPANTDANGFIPPTPRNYQTTFGNESNLPATTITRALEKITSFFQSQSQGIPGWKYAGSSTWDGQKKIGYDNLPTNFSGNKIQEPIYYTFERQGIPGWKYTGSSTAESIYDDFMNIGGGNPPPRGGGNPPPPTGDGNSPIKGMVDLNKKDNIELEEKIVKWGKILGIIYGIRKLLQGMSKLWKFGADTVTSRNQNINEELGYFSVDPEGAMRANVDKTRSMIYAGIRNLGANAPADKEAFDYSSKKFTDIWTAAMSGRGVDTRTTIDVQRLKDYFGIDLSPAALLTGSRNGKTATDVQIDVLNKVEKQLGILNQLTEEEKGQVIDSLKNVIGEKMLDALVANMNKNRLISDSSLKQTVVEKTVEAGGSAIHSKDLVEKTAGPIKALGELQEAFEGLKNTLVQELSPAFVTVTSGLINVIHFITKLLNKGDEETNEFGESASATSVSAMINGYRLNMNRYKVLGKQKEDDRKDVYKNREELLNKISRGEIKGRDIDVVYLAQYELENAATIEAMKMSQQERIVGSAIKNKQLDPNSSNPIISSLARHKYESFSEGWESIMQELTSTGEASPELIRLFTAPERMNELETLEAYRLFFSSSIGKKYFKKAFDKGGAFDFNTSMGIFQYLASPLGFTSQKDYEEYIQSLVNDMKENKYYENYMLNKDIKVSEWKDRNRNGRIDAGEVELTLVIKEEGTGKVLEEKPITFDIN